MPSHWALEVASVLVYAERNKRTSSDDTVRLAAILGNLPVIIDDQTAKRALGDVLTLARMHQLRAYDAAYLELALREGCPLASLDASLNEAAARLGIARFDG